MTRPEKILCQVGGGDRRSTGRADEVAARVSSRPELFPSLIEGMWTSDPVVRMRAADAVEKVTRDHPEWLQPFDRALRGLMAEAAQPELRWHLALMIPRLRGNLKQTLLTAAILTRWLEDGGSIVRTCALQGLAVLARQEPRLRPEVVEHLREAARTGTPAMKARSRKLLRQLAIREPAGS